MAIIPLGALTIPSIRRLLINKPGFPGGRLVSEVPPPPPVSLPTSGEKGSRRETVSRTATGFRAGAVLEVGTSGFAPATDLGFGFFAIGAEVPEEPVLPEAETGLMTLAVPAAFVPAVVPEEDFSAEPTAGFAVPLALLTGWTVAVEAADPDPAGELGAELDTGLGEAGVGFAAEGVPVGGAGFGLCGFDPTPSEVGI
jgi:hypothetical protein